MSLDIKSSVLGVFAGAIATLLVSLVIETFKTRQDAAVALSRAQALVDFSKEINSTTAKVTKFEIELDHAREKIESANKLVDEIQTQTKSRADEINGTAEDLDKFRIAIKQKALDYSKVIYPQLLKDTSKRMEERMTKLLEESKPYVLEVASDKKGTSKPLDKAIFTRLCEDGDGCMVTLGMKSWDEKYPESIAVIGPYELNYSSSTKEWRRSEYHNHPSGGPKTIVAARTGIDGNSKTEHVLIGWSKCYLTDGVYTNYKSDDSDASGLSLLLWRSATYSNPNTICRLVIRD